MDTCHLDLHVAPHTAVKQQHGFQVKEGHGLVRDAVCLEPINAPPRKRVVGFKGLLDMTMRSSLPAATPMQYTAAGHVEVVGTAHSTPQVRRMVKSVVQGIRACQDPEASSEGLGGTYFFMNDQGHKVAIMKPCDEEPLAPNNPKGFVGRALGDPGLKPTVRVGEAAMREVAAYLLDHGHFANVPCTVLVRFTHPVFHLAGDGGISTCQPPQLAESAGSQASTTTALDLLQSMEPAYSEALDLDAPSPSAKLGSLQEFVEHSGDSSEQGSSCFCTRDVHRIGILDLRLLNTDRHAGNLLCVQQAAGCEGSAAAGALGRLDRAKLALKPIDHGFCLPEALEPPFFEWLHWPQAMIPFDEEELAYIADLDPEADCELLRRELPWLRDECLRILTVATTLLKAAAAAGLSLSEIGSVLSRPLVGMDEEPSELEKLCATAAGEAMGLQGAVGRDGSGRTWYGEDSDDDWDRAGMCGALSDADTTTTHTLHGVQEESQDDMLFDLDEDGTASDFEHRHLPAHTHMLGMPLHANASSSAAHLPVSTVSPTSMSPTSPQRMRIRSTTFSHPGPPRSNSARSQASSSAYDAATIGPRGSGDSTSSRDFGGTSLDFATVQGQLCTKLSLEDAASSPEGPNAHGPLSFASGMWQRPGSRCTKQRVRRRPAVAKAGAAGNLPPVQVTASVSTSDAISSLTPQQWPHFLAALQVGIDSALAAGRWRAAAPTAKRGGLLSSCPRF